jgi:hypothetical protein
MTSPKTEYKAKVTTDMGLNRSRVPTPLLVALGARVGDYLIFRVTKTGKAIMRLVRAAKKSKKKRRSS